MAEEKKPSRASVMRKRRQEDGWARVDLHVPPGKALDALMRLSKSDPKQFSETLLDLLERA